MCSMQMYLAYIPSTGSHTQTHNRCLNWMGERWRNQHPFIFLAFLNNFLWCSNLFHRTSRKNHLGGPIILSSLCSRTHPTPDHAAHTQLMPALTADLCRSPHNFCFPVDSHSHSNFFFFTLFTFLYRCAETHRIYKNYAFS